MNIVDSWKSYSEMREQLDSSDDFAHTDLSISKIVKVLGKGDGALKLNGYLLSNVLYSNEDMFPLSWTVSLNNVWVQGLKTPQEGLKYVGVHPRWKLSMPYPQKKKKCDPMVSME